MSEVTKTITFVACGAVAAIAAWASQPRYSDPTAVEGSGVGEVLFPEFTDPFRAASMKVTEYDEELGEISEFEIAQRDGIWVLPTHDDYPAAADKNFQDAAMLLVGLKSIDAASDSRGDHELYGVRSPDVEDLKAGDKGVGKLLSFRDQDGGRIAELVIGDEVKESEGQRYVRREGEDRTFIAEIDPSKASTNFEDWINDDLLELSAFDVQQLELRDYTTQAQFTPRGIAVQYDQRFHAKIDWTDASKWELAELSEFRDDKLEPTKILDTEELNSEALDDMKSALDDLTIVDVRRKPEGLKADLSADQGFSQDQTAIRSLVDMGYYPASMPDGTVELLSSEGEVLCRTKDAVVYTLRFGKIAIGQDESTINRFVMVTASVDEAALPQPELEEVPEAATVEPATAPPEDGAGDSDSDEKGTKTAEGDADAADANDESEKADENKTDENKDEANAERDRIVKENQRKLDDYSDRRKKAEEKAGELNIRFAPWYYVISEDVYKKIHLSRTDLLTEKENAEELDNSVGAFEDLQREGLTKEKAPPADE